VWGGTPWTVADGTPDERMRRPLRSPACVVPRLLSPQKRDSTKYADKVRTLSSAFRSVATSHAQAPLN
jgi:hypothetical protein